MSYQNTLGPEPYRMDSDDTMASAPASIALSIPHGMDNHSHRIQKPSKHTITATNRMLYYYDHHFYCISLFRRRKITKKEGI